MGPFSSLLIVRSSPRYLSSVRQEMLGRLIVIYSYINDSALFLLDVMTNAIRLRKSYLKANRIKSHAICGKIIGGLLLWISDRPSCESTVPSSVVCYGVPADSRNGVRKGVCYGGCKLGQVGIWSVVGLLGRILIVLHALCTSAHWLHITVTSWSCTGFCPMAIQRSHHSDTGFLKKNRHC